MLRDIAWLSAGAPMDYANFNRRQTIRVGASVAFAQVGVIGFDGPIDLQSLRLYGLPEAAPAVLNGTPLLTGALFGSGRRDFAAEPALAAHRPIHGRRAIDLHHFGHHRSGLFWDKCVSREIGCSSR
jgi:hypothetical protein